MHLLVVLSLTVFGVGLVWPITAFRREERWRKWRLRNSLRTLQNLSSHIAPDEWLPWLTEVKVILLRIWHQCKWDCGTPIAGHRAGNGAGRLLNSAVTDGGCVYGGLVGAQAIPEVWCESSGNQGVSMALRTSGSSRMGSRLPRAEPTTSWES